MWWVVWCLNSCTILDRGYFVGSMLGRDWFGVLVLCEGFVYVPRHVAIDVSLQVVPGKMNAAKKKTRHVDCNGVVFLQCIDKVVHVVHVGDLDAKIIHH